ncbi:hypothetical protein [Edaphobacter modestus]|uniref:Uncharacterized protein n=1 Tax=Edaphobacter modestus TaxID=388466 RepID=A0A4Q7XXI6_9BACT|nr:hypothetical protein [Edaphobacter modestus]RZU29010.1 hypothetical protein BDD14_6598 [Edaphobacter modestus]
MKQHRRTAIYLAGILFLGLSEASYAQSGGTTVRDLPFSANEWITKTSTAADGTVNVTTQQIVVARSSDGTVRREIHEASSGPNRVIGRPIVLVSILNEDTKTNKATFKGKAAVTAMDTSRLQSISASKNSTARASTSSAGREISKLNGLEALVHRAQYSVPASDPNTKASTVTSELWYSPELHATLKSSISDSSGVTVVTVLDDIHRQEPDASLFRVGTEATTAQK